MNGEMSFARGISSTPHSSGMSRKFDFHDTDLFVEVEHPTRAQMIVIQCSKPPRVESQLVIELDKMEPGDPLEIETGEDPIKTVYLTKRDQKSSNQWWVCYWKVG